jgi:hypothetical protein
MPEVAAVIPLEAGALTEAATAIGKMFFQQNRSPRGFNPRAFSSFNFYAVTDYPQLDLLQRFFPATFVFPDPPTILHRISNINDQF